MRNGAGPASKRLRGIRALGAASLLALAVLAAAGPLDNNDVWIHLTTGRLILEEGKVPQTDRYSYTAQGNRYVAHEWLAACLYAGAERLAGESGVVAAGKVLPTLALVGLLLVLLARSGAPWGIAFPPTLLALLVARRRILARPELLALPLLLTVLGLLWRDRQAAREGRRTLALYWLVPIEALWANLHGSFPLGILLVLVFAAADAAERLLAPRDARARRLGALGAAAGLALAAALATLTTPAFGIPAAAVVACVAALFALDMRTALFHDAPSLRGQGTGRLLGIAAAMALAVLVNPLGADLWLFPFEFTASENVITVAVNEWKPLLEATHLHGHLRLPAYYAFVSLWLAALALAASRRALGRLEIGLLLALGLLPLRHVRWMAVFVLATAPALAATLGAARAGVDRGAPDRIRSLVATALGLASVCVAGLALHALASARFDARVAIPLLLAAGVGALAWVLARQRALPTRIGSVAGATAGLILAGLSLAPGIPEVARGPARSWLGDPSGIGPSLHARAATDFLALTKLRGKLFTEYAWAGYAIHRLWPDTHVFIDSRSEVYGPAALARFRRGMQSPQLARTLIDGSGTDLVMIRHAPYPAGDRLDKGPRAVVQGSRDWSLVYLDDRVLLFARRLPGRELPESLDELQPDLLRPRVRLGHAERRPALERAVRRAPDSAFLRLALSDALRAEGRRGEADAQLLEGWQANPRYPAVPMRLGELALEHGDRAAARRWFEAAARAKPGWNAPRRALSALGD